VFTAWPGAVETRSSGDSASVQSATTYLPTYLHDCFGANAYSVQPPRQSSYGSGGLIRHYD